MVTLPARPSPLVIWMPTSALVPVASNFACGKLEKPGSKPPMVNFESVLQDTYRSEPLGSTFLGYC